jgi:hypothetical protein
VLTKDQHTKLVFRKDIAYQVKFHHCNCLDINILWVLAPLDAKLNHKDIVIGVVPSLSKTFHISILSVVALNLAEPLHSLPATQSTPLAVQFRLFQLLSLAFQSIL